MGLILGFLPLIILHTLHRAYPTVGFANVNAPIVPRMRGF